MSIRPIEEKAEWGSSVAEISFDVPATSAEQAIEAAVEPLEAAIESLSFQLQLPLRVEGVGVADAHAQDAGTPGMFWQGAGEDPFPLRRFRVVGRELGGVETLPMPDLSVTLTLDARHRAALDWYLKALATPFAVDRFMFMWIAMEILWRDTVSEKAAWNGKRGSKIQSFLATEFGVPKGMAGRMWKARQVMHGDVPFNAEVMKDVGEYTLALRIGVNLKLKAKLGLGDTDPPLVGRPALTIAAVGLGGTTGPDADTEG